jgi:hypothetical protein
MTWRHTNEIDTNRFQIGKIIAGISAMAMFTLGASFVLWCANDKSSDLKFSAILFGVPSLGLFLSTMVNLLRLRKKLEAHIPNVPNTPSSSTKNNYTEAS